MNRVLAANFCVTRATCALALTLFLLAAAGRAQDVTSLVLPPIGISFSSLTGPGGAAYLGHSEGDFAVTPTAGKWFQSISYGNPGPSVFCQTAGVLQITDGPNPFTLSALDYSSNNGDSSYHLQGFLGSTVVFDDLGTLTGSFTPFSFRTLLSTDSSVQMDGLFIELFPGAGVTSINLDNILVVPVPEPRGLLWLGALLLAFVRSRRFSRV